MKHIFAWILKHKKTVLLFFIVAIIASFFMRNLVVVDYELMDYLPDASPSTIALNVMQDEYEGGIPNARLMVPVNGIAQALDYKKQIKAVDGVLDVTWLDDVVDVYEPLTNSDTDTVESYYKDGYALFSVTLDEAKQIAAYHKLKDIVGDDAAMEGSAISTVVATEQVAPEISSATKVIIAIIFIILILTTDSFFEPVLFLLTIGVAILLNQGTNLIFGTISFVTSAAGSILQLACSMDYSIFLLHRFAEYREKGMDVQDAMQNALEKSVSSISSSAFTTIIGFAALILMQFKIGPDMGIVMAKAIVLSTLCVMVLLPVLTIYCCKIIDKTHHRSFMPDFHILAGFVQRVRVPAMILFLALIVPAVLGQSNNAFYYGTSMIYPDASTKVGADRIQVEETFGKSNTLVLMVPRGDFAKEEQLSKSLKEIPQVTSILSYVDTVGTVIPTIYL
ncbi:MAG: MMPL family transporter, partial [Eubacteriales bacterium]|nr:MMPL family transporter [Eubacteriales bacterium]